MIHWTILTILLYFVVFSVLVVPLITTVAEVGLVLLWPFYISVAPVIVAAAAALLLVPAAISRQRPVSRRRVAVSAVVVAIPMTALVFGVIAAIGLMIWGEKGFNDYLYEWPALATVGALWIFWGVLFYRSYSPDTPESYVDRLTSWLLHGGLDVIVAIPSHIISRQREDCCAPPPDASGYRHRFGGGRPGCRAGLSAGVPSAGCQDTSATISKSQNKIKL